MTSLKQAAVIVPFSFGLYYMDALKAINRFLKQQEKLSGSEQKSPIESSHTSEERPVMPVSSDQF